MPKKTKKQKIEARRNRLQKNYEFENVSLQENVVVDDSPVQIITSTIRTTKTVKKVPLFQHQKENAEFFKNDLLKSLMITVVILCVQVGIYVAQLSGLFDITTFIRF